MSDSDPRDAPIFVVGTGRSGTTLLRLMLSAHSHIHIAHESSFYLVAARRRYRDVGDFLDYYLRTFPFEWLRIDPEVVRGAANRAWPRERIVEVFHVIMRTKASQYGKRRYGDKTPLHTAHLGAIFRDFANPRVVHIVRDPRATVASLMRMPWAPGNVGLNALFCNAQLKQVRRYRDQILEIRLEDLLAEPEPVMRRVLEFVGEEWEGRVLDHARWAPLDDVPPFPWFESARRPAWRDAEATAAWLRQLTPAQVRIVEGLNRYAMRTYGYERAELEGGGFFARWLSRFADFPEFVRCIGRLARIRWRIKRDTLPDPRQSLEMILDLNPGAWRHYPGFEIPQPGGAKPRAAETVQRR